MVMHDRMTTFDVGRTDFKDSARISIAPQEIIWAPLTEALARQVVFVM